MDALSWQGRQATYLPFEIGFRAGRGDRRSGSDSDAGLGPRAGGGTRGPSPSRHPRRRTLLGDVPSGPWSGRRPKGPLEGDGLRSAPRVEFRAEREAPAGRW